MKAQANFKKAELWILHSMVENDMRKIGLWNQVKGGQNNLNRYIERMSLSSEIENYLVQFKYQSVVTMKCPSASLQP